jgi:hypothetical protein
VKREEQIACGIIFRVFFEKSLDRVGAKLTWGGALEAKLSMAHAHFPICGEDAA